MRFLRRRLWGEMYAAWKQDHPDLCGDSFRSYRRGLVRGCAGKALYDDYAEAMTIVEGLPLRPGRVLHAYQCQLCGAWHVGNTIFIRKKAA